jgi:hypothetical protein
MIQWNLHQTPEHGSHYRGVRDGRIIGRIRETGGEWVLQAYVAGSLIDIAYFTSAEAAMRSTEKVNCTCPNCLPQEIVN